MFEKEAEEIVKRNVCGDCNRCQSHGYIGCDIYRYSKDSCLYGLREGYNKANEWHYPSKGELPKEDTAEKETLYLLWCGEKDFNTAEYVRERFWDLCGGWLEVDEVIAWKEIVLPKESK